MSQLRLVSVTSISLALLLSACGSGDSGSPESSRVAIDTNGDGVTDGFDSNGDGIIDSSPSSNSTQTRNRANFQPSNQNNSGNNNSGGSNGSNGSNSTTPVTRRLEVQQPLPFTAADFTALQSDAGFINSLSNAIFVIGTIQLFRVKGCKTADLQVKWATGQSWVTYANFFMESSATPGNYGEGARNSISLILPPGGAIKVRDDTNPQCVRGTTNAASVANDGVLYVGEPNSFDWNRAIFN